MATEVRFLGMKDINNFLEAIKNVEGRVVLFDPEGGFSTNAKSILGVLAATEWRKIYLDSDKDIYSLIEPFVVLGDDKELYHD